MTSCTCRQCSIDEPFRSKCSKFARTGRLLKAHTRKSVWSWLRGTYSNPSLSGAWGGLSPQDVDFSADSRKVLVASETRLVVADVCTGQLLAASDWNWLKLAPNLNKSACVRLSSDGKLVAYCDGLGNVHFMSVSAMPSSALMHSDGIDREQTTQIVLPVAAYGASRGIGGCWTVTGEVFLRMRGQSVCILAFV